jgi:hypothetical protein
VDRVCGIGVEDVGRVIAAGSDDRQVESTVGGADVQVLGGHLPVDDGGAAPLGEGMPQGRPCRIWFGVLVCAGR